MHLTLTVILMVIGLVPTLAQDGHKSVKTEIIRVPAPGSETLHVLDPETGSVQIDWKLAEDIVTTKSDRIALSIAQLMLAIRDGKWIPLR